MQKERVAYINGNYVSWDEAQVPIMSHSFGRGSAIFEVVGFHDTVHGPAVFRLDEHLARFCRSASLLEMEPPLHSEQLMEAVLSTVKRNGLKKGLIKMIGYYPEIAFEILPLASAFAIAIFVFGQEDVIQDRIASRHWGVTACISQWRRLDPQTVPIEAKAAANYLNGIMARREARKKGFEYAVMLDTQGFLAEGGTESLFLVRDGRLMTPSLGTILNSISRKSLLAVADDMGMETVTGKLSPELLVDAEEIFFSSTPTKVLPVRQMNDRVLEEGPGPVSRRIAERMETITSGCDERFQGWLFPI
jgi:branched-chain amino acid aminotransferase